MTTAFAWFKGISNGLVLGQIDLPGKFREMVLASQNAVPDVYTAIGDWSSRYELRIPSGIYTLRTATAVIDLQENSATEAIAMEFTEYKDGLELYQGIRSGKIKLDQATKGESLVAEPVITSVANPNDSVVHEEIDDTITAAENLATTPTEVDTGSATEAEPAPKVPNDLPADANGQRNAD